MTNASPTPETDMDDLYAPRARVKGAGSADVPQPTLADLDPIEREVFEGNRRTHERLVRRISSGLRQPGWK